MGFSFPKSLVGREVSLAYAKPGYWSIYLGTVIGPQSSDITKVKKWLIAAEM